MPTDSFEIIVIPALAALFVLLAWLADGLSYLYDYRATDDGVAFYLFKRIPLFTVPYSKIVEIRYCSTFEYLFSAVNLKNRFRQGRPILLVKNYGFVFRRALLTPSQPDVFLQTVERHRADAQSPGGEI